MTYLTHIRNLVEAAAIKYGASFPRREDADDHFAASGIPHLLALIAELVDAALGVQVEDAFDSEKPCFCFWNCYEPSGEHSVECLALRCALDKVRSGENVLPDSNSQDLTSV